jgi:hypothetical protein
MIHTFAQAWASEKGGTRHLFSPGSFKKSKEGKKDQSILIKNY